jgi:uncharacterized membrane protein YtjA (UPF0391 family)
LHSFRADSATVPAEAWDFVRIFCGTRFAREKTVAHNERINMLGWTLVFLVIALVAGVLGFAGIAGAAVGMARILFVIFLILFLVSLILRLARQGR